MRTKICYRSTNDIYVNTESTDVNEEVANILSNTSQPCSRLGDSPNKRFLSNFHSNLCYQFAALHLLKNFIELNGYDNSILDNLDMHEVDTFYLVNYKTIYLKLNKDPSLGYDIVSGSIMELENSYHNNQIESMGDFEDIDYSYVVETKLLYNDNGNLVFSSYVHPDDPDREVQLEIDSATNIYERLLQYGFAYDYFVSLITFMNLKQLIFHHEFKVIPFHHFCDVGTNTQVSQDFFELGSFLLVTNNDDGVNHYLSIIEKSNNLFEVGDDEKTLQFNSFDDVIVYIEQNDYELIVKHKIYFKR